MREARCGRATTWLIAAFALSSIAACACATSSPSREPSTTAPPHLLEKAYLRIFTRSATCAIDDALNTGQFFELFETETCRAGNTSVTAPDGSTVSEVAFYYLLSLSDSGDSFALLMFNVSTCSSESLRMSVSGETNKCLPPDDTEGLRKITARTGELSFYLTLPRRDSDVSSFCTPQESRDTKLFLSMRVGEQCNSSIATIVANLGRGDGLCHAAQYVFLPPSEALRNHFLLEPSSDQGTQGYRGQCLPGCEDCHVWVDDIQAGVCERNTLFLNPRDIRACPGEPPDTLGISGILVLATVGPLVVFAIITCAYLKLKRSRIAAHYSLIAELD